jgi:type I restriction enzyme S subunit
MISENSTVGWRPIRLGDIIKIKHGYGFKSEFFSDSGPYVLLTPGSFYEEGGFRARGEKEKYYDGPVEAEYVLHKGDLVVVMTEQAEGLLGSSGLIPENERFVHNQRLGLVVPLREGECDIRFLYYVFNYRPVRAQIRASSSGVKVRHTSPSRIGEVLVKLPPIDIQRRIAGMLCAYDDLHENNRRRLMILEEMARVFYREWFVEFRVPGVKLRKATPSENKVTGRDVFPEGWRIGVLGELVENIRLTTKAGPHLTELPYVPIDVIPRRSLALSEWRHGMEAQSSLCLFAKRDVLFGAMRAYFHKVVVAPFDGVTRSTCLVLRPFRAREHAYSVMLLFDERTVGYAAGHSRGTTIPYAVWRGGLDSMPVVIPNESVLTGFEEVAAPLVARIALSAAVETNLRRTRELLLPRLMSGEISLDRLDIATADHWEEEVAEATST